MLIANVCNIVWTNIILLQLSVCFVGNQHQNSFHTAYAKRTVWLWVLMNRFHHRIYMAVLMTNLSWYRMHVRMTTVGITGNGCLRESRNREAEADPIVIPPSHPEIPIEREYTISLIDRFFVSCMINQFFRFGLRFGFRRPRDWNNPCNRRNLWCGQYTYRYFLWQKGDKYGSRRWVERGCPNTRQSRRSERISGPKILRT